MINSIEDSIEIKQYEYGGLATVSGLTKAVNPI